MPIRDVFALVEAAKKDVENLSAEALKAELGNPDLLLADLRELEERVDAGSIPGARHVPRGMLEFWAAPSSPYYRDWFREDRRIVLFCAAGARSALAAKALADLGFTNVAHLETGFDEWAKAGEAVEDVRAASRWVRRGEDGEGDAAAD